MLARAPSSITSPRAVLTTIGVRLQQLQPAGRQQVIGGRGVRAVDRDDVHPGQHLVQALPVGRLQLVGDARADRLAVVIVDRQAEGLGAAGQGLADAAHADDAQTLAPRRRPSIQVGDQPGSRRDTTAAPSTIRRVEAMIRPMVRSAVSSVRTPGVLVTMMPRWLAVATSMLSTPAPKLAISFSRSPARDSSRESRRSVMVGTRTSPRPARRPVRPASSAGRRRSVRCRTAPASGFLPDRAACA